jgi:hypothetical protein
MSERTEPRVALEAQIKQNDPFGKQEQNLQRTPREFVNSHSQVWGENLPRLPSGSMRSWSDLNGKLKPEREGE